MKCFNAFTGETTNMPVYSPTLHSLRSSAKYWIVADAQLKRDLKGRTLRDVYRENRAGRETLPGKYVPRWEIESATGGGLEVTYSSNYKKPPLRDEYLAECAVRGHTPHPASIDGDHPMNCHRETCPKRETIKGEVYAVGGMGAMPYPDAMAQARAIHAQSGVFASIEQVL